MNTTSLSRRWPNAGLLVVGALALSAGTVSTAPVPRPGPVKRIMLAKNLFFETQGTQRRVIVIASVCLREGQLEGLMCRKNTKEHEYVLATDVDARQIHTALLAAGASPGSPVRFAPKYVPARGTVIKVRLQYTMGGKTINVPAHEWIKEAKSGKDLDKDWVFGGSQFVSDPDDPKKPAQYLANHGDVICLCNMETAMLDLPVRSPKRFEDRVYNAHKARIPPVNTSVEVILVPGVEKKPKGK